MKPILPMDPCNHLLASVVIPSHNRAASLSRVLLALTEQSIDMTRVEVIVVADGCTDETVSMLRERDWGLNLTVIDQAQSGVATTRNRGAQEAKAPLLIFLDDDVRPTPGCLAAHIAAQTKGPLVGIGHLTADPECTPPGWWRWMDWQLAKKYGEMETGERPVDGLALFSGNFSVPRELFWQVEGFDTQLAACEDTDLGIRLQKTGAAFRFNAQATGYHSGYHGFEAWKRIAYRDGRWDATEALKMAYPFGWQELLDGYKERHGLVKFAARTLVDRKNAFGITLGAMRVGGAIAGTLQLRSLERWVYAGIYALVYWQAVSDGIGGAALLWRYVRSQAVMEAPA